MIDLYKKRRLTILSDVKIDARKKISEQALDPYEEYEKNMNKRLDALKLPNNLKFKTINYKELNQLPSLQQLCNDVIQAKTNANIICFPYLQLEKRLNQASLEIDIKQVNNIDTKIKDAMKNKMLTFQQSI